MARGTYDLRGRDLWGLFAVVIVSACVKTALHLPSEDGGDGGDAGGGGDAGSGDAADAAPEVVIVSISKGLAGAASNQASNRPKVSADGRYVVYESLATNLVPDDTNLFQDVFIY